MADEMKEVLVALNKIEDRLNTLEQVRNTQAVDKISKEEVEAFVKVRDMLSFTPDTVCGINETSPCIINRCITRCITLCDFTCRSCDVECTCGPCSFGGGGIGSGGRFGGLGR